MPDHQIDLKTLLVEKPDCDAGTVQQLRNALAQGGTQYRSLREAAELLNQSRLARRVLGDAVVDFYVHTARLEAAAFDNAVTDWERVRYFERI